MMVKRGKIWLADLNPIRGSEQAGTLIFQNDAINKFTTTVIVIPLTTNIRRAALPSCVLLAQGEGGLFHASVALGHQLCVLDQTRLHRRLGAVHDETMLAIEKCVLFTLGIV
jgi:mRNA interferase MazF